MKSRTVFSALRCMTAFTVFLMGSSDVLFAQASAATVPVSNGFMGNLRWILVGVMFVLLFLVYIARMITRELHELREKAITGVTGRNKREGLREMIAITVLGLAGIGAAFAITYTPAPKIAGPPKEDPNKELAAAEIVLVADNAIIQQGKSKFDNLCAACHGTKGEGLVGPNLTDSTWIHGGSASAIYNTITVGVPDKGMMPWKGALKPKERLAVVAYINSLKGSNPPNAKAAEGDSVVVGK